MQDQINIRSLVEEKWAKVHLKGLAMIFSGQENPLIIFRSKKDIYESKEITKSM